MTMRNRVTPMGDIVAIPQRGAWLGNRGILHRGTDIVRFHASKLWITCALQFRGWQLQQWHPHHFTVLFFYDEAVTLAAGHRPCALCRRPAYNEFRAALGEPDLHAADLDGRLHAERLYAGTHRRRLHRLPWRELPDGAFVLLDEGPALVAGEALRPWSADGYGGPLTRPTAGAASVVTPPLALAALRGGYPVQLALREPSGQRRPLAQ
ncbi:hypothetical protein [Nakamurella lactea]|uniref:hypothetical protein n=1 Tax=Nakamurella lactea TaxID=459515 RepID=UPI0004027F7B|nr:hypothetical protein [Nakamurella lactea]